MAEEGPFELKGLIGQGAFGKVFLLEDDKGNKRALKAIEIVGKSMKEVEMTIQEMQLLASMDHPHILHYIHAFQEGPYLMLVTEYCACGDIGSYMKDHAGTVMDESRLLEWIRQITSALQYLHEKNIIHRDLKTANIFLDENWDTKLGDFGIARILQSPVDMAATQCGTPLYMSPEVFQGIPYTAKTDIYSLGIMMYEMANMDQEFEAIAPHLLLYKIVHELVPTMPTAYSQGVINLMLTMLKKNPDERPSAAQILKSPVMQKAKKPPKINSSHTVKVTEKYEHDGAFDMKKLRGTLTALGKSRRFADPGGKGKQTNIGQGKKASEDQDEFASHPVMGIVSRTLKGMGHDHQKTMAGRSVLQRQGAMLKAYCMNCLDDDQALFQEACDALDTDQPEDDIEEMLISILGNEKFAVCGVQLLYYKNFSFNLKK